MTFTHLFEPARIGDMTIRNRIVMLPMTTGYGEPDETVGRRFIRFFADRARGGAGLIIIPFSPVRAGSPEEPGLFHDRFVPFLRPLTSRLRDEGAKSAAQLITSYHIAFGDGGPEVVGPSPVMNQMMRVTPRVLTVDEIRFVVAEYGKAARRAREGGFDAVEILVGGGYLLNRFLSPVSNERSDGYGGTLENRMRIILEIVASVRKEAGKDFPVGCRLNIEEQMTGGHTLAESKVVARALEEAGVAMINVYTGWHESPVPTVAPSLPPGAFAHLSGGIREAVGIPVIAANRINDPFIAEKILAEGKADLAGMGRALLADPELPNKARESRTDEIVPCLACSHCLGEIMGTYKNWGRIFSTSCVVNPRAGREEETEPRPADSRKRVFVVGGGPGGLAAALAAAERGHDVTLFEKEKDLGGRLLTAALPPFKEPIGTLARSLAARGRKAGVRFRLECPAEPERMGEEKPDVLIVATGADSLVPDIPGAGGPRVAGAEEVLAGRKAVSGTVIVIGGGMVGCETAEFLLERAKGVTRVIVLEMMDRMAQNVSPTYRPFFLARLKKMGVELETGTTVTEITGDGVKVLRKGSPEFVAADSVVLAAGYRADPSKTAVFRNAAPEVYAVGDCAGARMIKDAIEEGFHTGRSL